MIAHMSRSTDFEYHKTYKLLILGASISGLYFSSAEKIVRQKWILVTFRCLPVVPLFILPFYCSCQIKFMLFDEGTVQQKLFAVGLIFFTGLSSFVVVTFHLRRKKFDQLFDWWETFRTDDLFPEDEVVLMRAMSSFTNKLYVLLFSVAVFAAILYATLILLNEERDLGHPMGFSYRRDSPIYEFVVLLEIAMGTFGFLTLVSYDSFATLFVSMEVVFYKHLNKSLSRILDGLTVTKLGDVVIGSTSLTVDLLPDGSPDEILQKVFQETEMKIHVWMRHHQNILRYHDEIQKMYASTFAVKHVTFIIMLCVFSFLSTTAGMELKSMIAAALYIVNNYSSHYLNIYLSDCITEEARSLFDDAFSKDWSIYPKKLMSIFTIILTKKNRIVQFVCLKIFPLNSKSFLKVISTAYSLFTFLLQITGEEVPMP